MSDVWYNREKDDLYRLCEGLVAEKKRLRKILENLAEACETNTQTQTEECLAIVIREELKIDLSLPFGASSTLSRPQRGPDVPTEPQPPRKSSVEQEMDDSAEYLRTGINNETQAKQVSVEGLADWFYDHGWEFVVADDEEVVKDLLNSFDITRKYT